MKQKEKSIIADENNSEHKLELEMNLLSTILTYKETFIDAVGLISNEAIFDKPEHRVIFKDAMDYFSRTGKAPDFEDVFEIQILSKENRTDIKQYLSSLARVETKLKEIGKIIREIIEMKAESEMKAFESTTRETGLDYLQAVSDKALEITEKYIDGCRKEKSNYEIAEGVISYIMKGSENNYIKTGFEKLDRNINGIPKRHLTIIAGRPGTGKTTFMLQLLRNFIKQNLKIGIFSLEMTAESLMIKNLSALTGIDSLRIESGNLTHQEKQLLTNSAKELSMDNYTIIDNSVQTPAMIKAQINLWKIKNQADLVMIDYLTLINTNYRESRQDLEIGKLSKELNSIAKTTGIPIILLSQLNRQSEARTDKKPQLADLRESGSIEQDANLVLLLYRPFLYGINPLKDNIDYSFTTLSGEELKKEEYFEVIIAKARNGRTGKVEFRYMPEVHTVESVKVERLSGERIPSDYEHLLKVI